MSLFEDGPFTLPSGTVTHFKIECDVLTESDWAALAKLAVGVLPPFKAVEGVPRGGLVFADALKPYVSTYGSLLIADDVWVTGLSMDRQRAGRNVIGVVAFSRGPHLPWVTALFQMNAEAENVTYNSIGG